MAMKCKEYRPFSLKLEKSLSDKLEQVCETTHLSKTAVVEIGLEMYFREYDKQKEGSLSEKVACN